MSSVKQTFYSDLFLIVQLTTKWFYPVKLLKNRCKIFCILDAFSSFFVSPLPTKKDIERWKETKRSKKGWQRTKAFQSRKCQKWKNFKELYFTNSYCHVKSHSTFSIIYSKETKQVTAAELIPVNLENQSICQQGTLHGPHVIGKILMR